MSSPTDRHTGPAVGVVYTSGLDDWLRRPGAPVVEPVVEIEPQTLWVHADGAAQPYRVVEEELERVRSLPGDKLLHGIGFAVGGSVAPDPRQLPALRRTIAALDPRWVSEHLSFNAFDDGGAVQLTGFQLPPRQSLEGARAAARSIRSLASAIDAPFAVETGVSYLQPRPDELDDGAFLAEVTEAADCGIVLDLHNLWTNERNGRQPAREVIARIPRERVWEIHVAGGEERRGYWLDGHCAGVPQPVLDLLRDVAPHLPRLEVVIFELFAAYLPRFGTDWVGEQLAAIAAVLRTPRHTALPTPRPPAEPAPGPDPATWERALGRLVLGFPPDGPLERDLAGDGGVALVRELLGEFRASMFASAMPLSCRLLLLSLGAERLTSLLADFADRRPPQRFASTEARAFVAWVRERALDVPYLDDVVAYELAVLATATHGRATVVELQHDPLAVCRAIAEGRLPDAPARGRFEVEVTP